MEPCQDRQPLRPSHLPALAKSSGPASKQVTSHGSTTGTTEGEVLGRVVGDKAWSGVMTGAESFLFLTKNIHSH